VRAFEEIWDQVSEIWGLVLESEMWALYDAATRCDPGSHFLEVGCLCGRSSAVLGMVAMDNGCHLTCVDNFSFVHQRGGLCINEFLRNMKKLHIEVTLMMMGSDKAAKIYNRPIDLLYIDGDHSYVAVRQDCDLWLPYLKPGGWAAFHDYGSAPGRPVHPGVKRAVDETTHGYEDFGVVQRMKVLRKWRYENSDPVNL